MRNLRHAPPYVRYNVDNVSRLALLPPILSGGLHHVPRAVEVGINHREPTLDTEVDGRLWELARPRC